MNDRVAVAAGTTVTYDRQSDADLSCVNVHGQLTFRTDVSTRLTVGTLTVMPGAGLQIGTSGSPVAATVTAEIVISDRPVDTGIRSRTVRHGPARVRPDHDARIGEVADVRAALG